MRSNKLIISHTTYPWVKYCTGLILKNSKDFQVMIIFSDDDVGIINYYNLCENAVYEQRTYDLYNIGIKLKIPKLFSLRLNKDNIDLHSLTAKIQLQVILGGISEIYYQKSYLLDEIIKNLVKEYHIKAFSYCDVSKDIKVDLDTSEYETKLELRKFMIGIPENKCILGFKPYEYFDEVKI